MSDDRRRTAGELGEFAVVDAITGRFAQGDRVLIGPGDDAAAVTVPGGVVVASVDLLVQDRHFRLDWSSAADIGHKAAAESMSDINAMGGSATALLVGLGCPPDVESGWLLELADGIADEAHEVGASVVGGDLTAAATIVLSVTVLGTCADTVVRRSGAQPGDVLALAGRQGWAAAGFAVLSRGFRSPRLVVEAHRRPQPPYAAGPEAARLGATAMIDVSDGFLQDAGHLAAAGGVVIDIERDRLDLPEPLHSVGAALGVDPMHLVLTGGDDYGLLATFPPETALPDTWRVVGRVLAAEVREGGGAGATSDGRADGGAAQAVGPVAGRVTVDGVDYPLAAGHEHFR